MHLYNYVVTNFSFCQNFLSIYGHKEENFIERIMMFILSKAMRYAVQLIPWPISHEWELSDKISAISRSIKDLPAGKTSCCDQRIPLCNGSVLSLLTQEFIPCDLIGLVSLYLFDHVRSRY